MKKIVLYVLPLLLILSCEEIVLEDDISDKTVVLLAPANNAQFFSTGITFTWDAVEYVEEYRIQIARPNFNNPLQIVTDAVINTTSFTTQLAIGEYEWRVQGVNSSYETPFTTRSLTVVSNEDFQSNTVVLTSPTDNLITNTTTQNLVWQPILGTVNYDVQIFNTSSNALVEEQEVTITTFSYAFPDGNYQWRVRASNGDQNTLYSSRNLLVDTTEPNKPILNTPASSTEIPDNEDITFTWTRTTIEGSIETDVIYIYNNSGLTGSPIHESEEESPYEYDASALISGNTYYWYVQSFDEAGNEGLQSDTYQFTIQ
ncbi:hypothetical protein [Flavobacterium litorale]|uniref:Fibronectin type-III domain-containing protein n=1 Tax=Flavobacterium litorale TaxID=2856519 RepID=A0ABX8V628_9FLAO|nr:hypothetical protein [Flavobacterium litorale]QYJ68270.1 hypothetical protein K1I41_12210 [Flavobacterium litorale]